MKTSKTVRAAMATLLTGAVLAPSLAACEKGPAEKAGQKIDNAADKAGDKIKDAGDKVKDAAHGG
jgi:hypothetical protein